ncbi:MAG TPA: CpaD family pilus assembly protein [Stellaceae bacterium]|nr:CpaD family pilus assembly protein [Stellaceae bacterium]
MTAKILLDRSRSVRFAGLLIGLAAALSACTHTDDRVVTASIPEDYRLRHPIAVEEGNQSMVVFVGRGRGGLTATQRAEVMGLGQTWMREGTGAITADVPVNTPNSRAAADSLHEIQSLLAAVGVPPHGLVVHNYHPDDAKFMPPIRLTYPRVKAVAGPCGLWPEDIGPSIHNKGYYDNRSYYNFGCAYQRNIAAMIDDPADLEQPRSETPPYTIRRSEAFEKYRKGTSTTTVYPEAEKAKLSTTGQ